MNIFKTKRQKLNFYKLLHFFAYLFSITIFCIGILRLLPEPKSGDIEIVSNFIFALVVIYLIQTFLSKHHKKGFKHLMGFSFKKTSRHLTQGLLGFCYIITINFLIFSIINLALNGTLDFSTSNKQNENYSIIISAIAVAPWFEEILFRGYIQSFFTKFFKSKTSIFITSFLFMVFHMQYWENFYSLSAVFILSSVLGILRIKTKSVTPCIFAHFLNNLFAVIRF